MKFNKRAKICMIRKKKQFENEKNLKEKKKNVGASEADHF